MDPCSSALSFLGLGTPDSKNLLQLSRLPRTLQLFPPFVWSFPLFRRPLSNSSNGGGKPRLFCSGAILPTHSHRGSVCGRKPPGGSAYSPLPYFPPLSSKRGAGAAEGILRKGLHPGTTPPRAVDGDLMRRPEHTPFKAGRCSLNSKGTTFSRTSGRCAAC